LSDHPVDRLIQELIQTRRAFSAAEISSIRQRMMDVPFLSESSLADHLVRRKADGQWAGTTTPAMYHADLREAIRLGRIATFERRGGAMAAAFALTADVVQSGRQGPDPEPGLFVVYSADRGRLVTGYQFSDTADLALPGGIIWLE